jgi:hypothetical protein
VWEVVVEKLIVLQLMMQAAAVYGTEASLPYKKRATCPYSSQD